jgi:hypothetical protein
MRSRFRHRQTFASLHWQDKRPKTHLEKLRRREEEPILFCVILETNNDIKFD